MNEIRAPTNTAANRSSMMNVTGFTRRAPDQLDTVAGRNVDGRLTRATRSGTDVGEFIPTGEYSAGASRQPVELTIPGQPIGSCTRSASVRRARRHAGSNCRWSTVARPARLELTTFRSAT
jgi:hypothetical protein